MVSAVGRWHHVDLTAEQLATAVRQYLERVGDMGLDPERVTLFQVRLAFDGSAAANYLELSEPGVAPIVNDTTHYTPYMRSVSLSGGYYLDKVAELWGLERGPNEGDQLVKNRILRMPGISNLRVWPKSKDGELDLIAHYYGTKRGSQETDAELHARLLNQEAGMKANAGWVK